MKTLKQKVQKEWNIFKVAAMAGAPEQGLESPAIVGVVMEKASTHLIGVKALIAEKGASLPPETLWSFLHLPQREIFKYLVEVLGDEVAVKSYLRAQAAERTPFSREKVAALLVLQGNSPEQVQEKLGAALGADAKLYAQRAHTVMYMLV